MQAAGSLKTVVIEVRPREETEGLVQRVLAAGEAARSARIGFASWDDLHKVLAPKRMAIVRTMAGAGPLSIREIARRVGRDFKGVHSDVTMLAGNGIIDRTDDGKVVFPFEQLRVEYASSKAA